MAIQVPVVFRGDADDLVDDLDRSLRSQTARVFSGFGREAADKFSKAFDRGTKRHMRGSLTGSIVAALQGVAIRDPRVFAVLGASVAALFPAIGTLAAGSFVLAFGAGLAGLGLAVAAQDDKIKSLFKDLGGDIADTMREITKPFQATLRVVAQVTRETFNAFVPALEKSFSRMAPVISQFTRRLGEAFEQLAPTIQPVTTAFIRILREAGPRLVPFFQELAKSITNMAKAISANPDVFADIFGNLLGIIPKLLNFIALLTRTQARIESFFGTLSRGPVGDTFRKTIDKITGGVKEFFSILNQGNEVGKTFEAIKKFVEPLVPIFQKTAEAVGGVLAKGFREIAQLINAELLPAFQRFLPAIRPITVFIVKILGTAVVEAFKGAIQVIKGAIQIISGLLNLFASVLTGDWSGAWNALKQIAVGAFHVIVGAIRIFLSVTIIGAFRRFIVFLTKGLWVGLFRLLVGGTKTGFNGIIRVFTSTLKVLVRVVVGFVRGYLRFWTSLFRGALSIAVNGWKVLRSAFGGPLAAIRTIVAQTFRAIVGFIRSSFASALGAVRSAWTAITGAVSRGVSTAVGFVRGLPGKMGAILRGGIGTLAAAGAALIQGLVDSVQGKLGDLLGSVKDALGKIKDLLPGSPIKSGPLKSWNGGAPGRKLMELIAKGIRSGSASAIKSVLSAFDKISDLVSKQLKDGDLGKKAASAIQKQLRQMSAAVEREAARTAKLLSDRLDFVKQFADSFKGEFNLEDVFNASGGDIGAFTGGVSAIAARIRRFANKLNALRKLGIPKALIMEVAGLGSETGIPVANMLLSSTAKQIKQLTSAFNAFTSAANFGGNVAANAQFGTPGEIRKEGRRRMQEIPGFRNLRSAERINITNNFYGPSTSGGRLQEMEWTLRYATRRSVTGERPGTEVMPK